MPGAQRFGENPSFSTPGPRRGEPLSEVGRGIESSVVCFVIGVAYSSGNRHVAPPMRDWRTVEDPRACRTVRRIRLDTRCRPNDRCAIGAPFPSGSKPDFSTLVAADRTARPHFVLGNAQALGGCKVLLTSEISRFVRKGLTWLPRFSLVLR